MNQSIKAQKSRLPEIIAILLVIGAIGYYFYSSGSNGSASSSFTISSATSSVGANVLGLLNQIHSLKIDASLFQSPVYQSLNDFTVQVPPEPIGKSNPFVAGGAGVSPAFTASTSSTTAGR